MKSIDQKRHEAIIKKKLDDPETFDFPVTELPNPPEHLDRLASEYFYMAAQYFMERGRLTVAGVYYLATVCELLADVKQQPGYFSKEQAKKRGMKVVDHWPEEEFQAIGRAQRLKLIEKYLSWMGGSLEWIEKSGIDARAIIEKS